MDTNKDNTTILRPGTPAPTFQLHYSPDQYFSLSDLNDSNLILAFYPADWSPVCGDQMSLYNELLAEFGQYNAKLVGISVDGAWCHRAYSQDRKLQFPLLSDFEPKGAVARAYGVYSHEEGVCERALFVIDSNGIIQWSYLSPVDVNPGADGILKALEDITTKHRAAAKVSTT